MNKYPSKSWFKLPYLKICTLLGLLMGVKLPAQAQTPQVSPPGGSLDNLPTTPLPGRSQDPVITPLPPVEDFLDSLPNQLPEGELPESEVEFEVKEFQLEDNTVLQSRELERIFRKYRNRPLNFADLLELETELTNLYTAKGYINSGVVVPIQDINQGIVILKAVEGTIDTINVEVSGRLAKNYVRSRLARGANKPFNIEELQSALQLLQLNPLIDSLNAELSVGNSRERWNLDVTVNQGDEFDSVLFANNSRTPSVGSFQRGIELNHNNFFGYGDRLSFVYRNTDGSNDFDTSFQVPINALDGTLGIRYRDIGSDIIEGNFEAAEIESETDDLELTFRQPIILRADGESTQELAVGVEFSRQTNQVTVMDQPFPDLSPGADENGETNISALRFFQDWTRRSRQDVFAARSQFSTGLDVFDATINEGAPDSLFVSWRGQVQWLRQLQSSSNINLLLRSDIQLSSDDLVPLERFSLGGIDSVRGYRQDALLGDSGILASAEVRIPFYRWSDNQSSISAVPFFDFGTTWSNSEETAPEEDTIASLGVGLRLNILDTLNARLDVGIPLVEVEDTNDTLQEQGIYFSMEYLPF